MMDTSKRRSGFLPRLLLVGFGIILAAVVAEIGLRATEAIQLRRARVLVEEGDPSKFWMTYDADIGYRLTPNYGRYNADGLKDHPVTPKNGRFRLLFLGDSIIYDGIGLDDTLVTYLRAELDKDRMLAPVDTLNAGIPGYTNWQELMFLKKYGLKFEPDLVGVEFCLNDLPKILQQFHVENGRIIPGPWYTVEEAKAS